MKVAKLIPTVDLANKGNIYLVREIKGKHPHLSTMPIAYRSVYYLFQGEKLTPKSEGPQSLM
jgi:hypothetical protein